MILNVIIAACFLAETAGVLLYIWNRDQHEAAERVRLRAEHTQQIDKLLNRIQAPEVAAFQATEEPSPDPLYVPAEDDQAFAEYVEDRKAGLVN